MSIEWTEWKRKNRMDTESRDRHVSMWMRRAENWWDTEILDPGSCLSCHPVPSWTATENAKMQHDTCEPFSLSYYIIILRARAFDGWRNSAMTKEKMKKTSHAQKGKERKCGEEGIETSLRRMTNDRSRGAPAHCAGELRHDVWNVVYEPMNKTYIYRVSAKCYRRLGRPKGKAEGSYKNSLLMFHWRHWILIIYFHDRALPL